MMHLVEVCVRACLSVRKVTLKITAYICFLLRSYVDCRKISDGFAGQVKVEVIFQRV